MSEFSLLISNIKSLLSFNSNFNVKFIMRQTNIIVHIMLRRQFFGLVVVYFSCCLLVLTLFFKIREQI
jgi:hypothetical protein